MKSPRWILNNKWCAVEIVRKNRRESPVWYNSPNINVFRFISSLYYDICIVPGPGISVGRLVRLVFMPLFQPLFFVRYLYVVSSLNINAKREKWTFCLGQNANRIVSNFFHFTSAFFRKITRIFVACKHPRTSEFPFVFLFERDGKSENKKFALCVVFLGGETVSGGWGWWVCGRNYVIPFFPRMSS